MNNVLISLTTRQLLGRRRTLVIGLLLALPILSAVIYRFSDKPAQGMQPRRSHSAWSA